MKEDILVFALENALEHGGKANPGSIIGKMMSRRPELRKDAKGLSRIVAEVVRDVNSMSVEKMERTLQELGGPIEMRKRERKDPMVPLKDIPSKEVRMRFAPGPSGPLHMGHTRACILNDEYCRRYHGKFILRMEDTNPEKIDPDAYRMIPEDLDWLGISIDERYIQSDRFEIYYDIVRDLLEDGNAYVCTMDLEQWRELKERSAPCPERNLDPTEQLEKWDRMKSGDYNEGEAAVVVKTDLKHRNPAVRDFVGMRIRYAPHPRTGDRFHLYPLYNLSVAIDDHLMDCTHILRGKDHLNNTFRQEYVYKHMGWELPEFIHYGLVSIPDTILKTSLIGDEIRKGKFTGWNDIRLGTVRALARRGFHPDAIRRYWREVGTKGVDIQFSWETLKTMNREIIDPISDRLFFVENPVPVEIPTDKTLTSRSPVHPEDPQRGFRVQELIPKNGRIKLYISREDMDQISPGNPIRLKDLANISLEDGSGKIKYLGNDHESIKGRGYSIIQWVTENAPEFMLLLPDGSVRSGMIEEEAIKASSENKTVQLERVGFCKLEKNGDIKGLFTHK